MRDWGRTLQLPVLDFDFLLIVENQLKILPFFWRKDVTLNSGKMGVTQKIRANFVRIADSLCYAKSVMNLLVKNMMGP